MYRGYLRLGDTEVANTARTVAYMRNGVKNPTAEVVTDDSWPFTYWWLGRAEAWSLPELDDDCPWYDPRESASAEFAGVWPLSVEGLETTPVEREVIESSSDGGGFGVHRTPTRVISVEALVVGATPAGLDYGLGWLNGALRASGPRDLVFLASAPPVSEEMERGQVMALGDAEVRMVSRVVLTSQVEVEERYGPWSLEGHGATWAKVSFELTAGVPWVWLPPELLVSGLRPYEGAEVSLSFDSSGAPAAESSGFLFDPKDAPVTVLPRATTSAAGLGMGPFESKRLCWRLDGGRLSSWFESLPTVSVSAGPVEERNMRFTWVEGVVEEGALEEEWAGRKAAEAVVRYLPARGRLTLDAVTGEARVVTVDGQNLDATPVVTGRSGGPWRAPALNPRSTYTLVVDAEASVDLETTVAVTATARRP